MGWIRGAYSGVKTHVIRFVEVVFFLGDSQAPFSCVGLLPGAYSVVNVQVIRFVEVVFFWATHRPLFRMWGGYGELTQLLMYRGFVLSGRGDLFCGGGVSSSGVSPSP